MFTARPVRPAATSRSVCRQRNAGICRMSHTSAAASAWDGSWMSVSTDSPVSRRISASACRPWARPGPRYESKLVRLALSNEALNTVVTPDARPAFATSRPTVSACSGDSITQGPQIANRFSRAKTRPSRSSMHRRSIGTPVACNAARQRAWNQHTAAWRDHAITFELTHH